MESATILTPPSFGLSGILLSVRTQKTGTAHNLYNFSVQRFFSMLSNLLTHEPRHVISHIVTFWQV